MLDSIGNKKQDIIYSGGIRTWQDFLDAKKIPGISAKRKILYDLKIRALQKAIQERNIELIKKMLPRKDYWRLYHLMLDKTLFLDIETSEYYGDITIIGMFSRQMDEPIIMVANHNLDEELFFRILSSHDIIVTFNGSSFDIPIIENFFRRKISLLHIDLRHLCARLGLNAGLKVIEKMLGIERKHSCPDPVLYWDMWMATRSEEYLNKLVEYNKEDVMNLVHVMEYCVKQLAG